MIATASRRSGSRQPSFASSDGCLELLDFWDSLSLGDGLGLPHQRVVNLRHGSAEFRKLLPRRRQRATPSSRMRDDSHEFEKRSSGRSKLRASSSRGIDNTDRADQAARLCAVTGPVNARFCRSPGAGSVSPGLMTGPGRTRPAAGPHTGLAAPKCPRYRRRRAAPGPRLLVLAAAGSASSRARIPRATLTSSPGRSSSSRSTTWYIQ